MEKEPKISFVFNRRNKATATTTAVVELRVYYGRQRAYLSTGVMLYEGQWLNDKVVNRYDATALNVSLSQMYTALNNYVYKCIGENQEFDVGMLANYRLTIEEPAKLSARNAINEDPFTWMEGRLVNRNITPGTMRNNTRTIEMLRLSGLFKSWNDFTPANITLWNDYLLKRKIRQSTIYSYHKRVRMFMREAEVFGKIAKNPYLNMRIDQGKHKGIKYITKEERARIEALELEGGEEKARDIFIFSCYTGLSYSDLIKIKKSDIKHRDGHYFIEDKRKKTGTDYHVVLLPKAQEILKKWDYNLDIITNQKANYYLKFVQVLARIDTNLSMHVGRHSFATWALSEGIPIEVVSRMLAHTNIAVTQIYAKVIPTKIDQAYSMLQALG